MLLQILLGLVLAVGAAFAAHRLHTLTRGGAYAAAVLGTVVFGLGGWQWAVLLLAFFILSSALSRAFRRAKLVAEQEKYAKGSERDEMQVLGNGGVAGIFVLLHALFPQAGWTWIGFAGALAAVNADTWATELGVLNPWQPRLITSPGTRVEMGTSGGISLVGTLASLLAAALIGALAALLMPTTSWDVVGVVALAGLGGSLVDSLLGATLQAIYFCPKDQKETEKHPLHTCGTPTVKIRGLSWLDNDWVNAACGAAGALLALGLAAALRLL